MARLTTFRGVPDVRRLGVADINELTAGTTIGPQKGFASTTPNSAAARSFIGRDGVLLMLHVPENSPAAWLADIGDPQCSWQQELLLAPGARILVTAVRQWDSTTVIVGEVSW